MSNAQLQQPAAPQVAPQVAPPAAPARQNAAINFTAPLVLEGRLDPITAAIYEVLNIRTKAIRHATGRVYTILTEFTNDALAEVARRGALVPPVAPAPAPAPAPPPPTRVFACTHATVPAYQYRLLPGVAVAYAALGIPTAVVVDDGEHTARVAAEGGDYTVHVDHLVGFDAWLAGVRQQPVPPPPPAVMVPLGAGPVFERSYIVEPPHAVQVLARLTNRRFLRVQDAGGVVHWVLDAGQPGGLAEAISLLGLWA